MDAWRYEFIFLIYLFSCVQARYLMSESIIFYLFYSLSIKCSVVRITSCLAFPVAPFACWRNVDLNKTEHRCKKIFPFFFDPIKVTKYHPNFMNYTSIIFEVFYCFVALLQFHLFGSCILTVAPPPVLRWIIEEGRFWENQ
jgi:hypothetical protein